MAEHNLVRDLNYIAAELDLVLEYIRALQRSLGDQTTTRLEDDGRPIIAIDNIPEGAPVYLHLGVRYPYASRSPQPSNVLQSPGLMDVPLNIRAPGNVHFSPARGFVHSTSANSFGTDHVDEHLGIQRNSVDDAGDVEDIKNFYVHSATCGTTAGGKCDCGAQRDIADERADGGA
jgi:hypothetical protein